ncbi:MAG: sugar phosphate isomerase/epimerase family protein [Halobacteria archaeon]
MDPPKLGASSLSFPGEKPVAERLALLPPLQLTHAEVNLNADPLPWTREAHRALREAARSAGLSLGLHAPHLHLDPGHPDERVGEPSLSLLETWAKAAGPLKADHLVVHPSPEGELEDSVEPLKRLSKAAGKLLLVENQDRGPGASERDLERLLDDGGARLALDIGHLFIARSRGLSRATLRDLLRTFGDKVPLVHLNDNRGREDLHLVPGKGEVPWDKVLPALREAKIKLWVIESRGGLEESVKFLREALKREGEPK